MERVIQLPIIDLSSSDRTSIANSIRQACMEYGFFYIMNHGVDEELLQRIFTESRKLFSLPLEEKMALVGKELRGYKPLYNEKPDPSSTTKGDSKEVFDIGPIEEGSRTLSFLNQWPSEESLPSWRVTMESYHNKVRSAGKKLMSLIALSLNLNEEFFEKEGAFDQPILFLRLAHYPGEMGFSGEEKYGASAHSDYGMVTLLTTDGVRGLQVCREKSNEPQVWEDVPHINGRVLDLIRALIVNIGDMTERWTNGLFRSTLHRVMPTGQERYSVVFFFNPNYECLVKCLESCCSESCPPRFPPIRVGDYFKEKFKFLYRV